MAATNFRGFQVDFGKITNRIANWQGLTNLKDTPSCGPIAVRRTDWDLRKEAFFYDGYYFYHVDLISFI